VRGNIGLESAHTPPGFSFRVGSVCGHDHDLLFARDVLYERPALREVE
jgi:hypothetical protein